MLKDLLIFLNIIDEIKVPVPMQWQERAPRPRISKTELVKEPEMISTEWKQ